MYMYFSSTVDSMPQWKELHAKCILRSYVKIYFRLTFLYIWVHVLCLMNNWLCVLASVISLIECSIPLVLLVLSVLSDLCPALDSTFTSSPREHDQKWEHDLGLYYTTLVTLRGWTCDLSWVIHQNVPTSFH